MGHWFFFNSRSRTFFPLRFFVPRLPPAEMRRHTREKVKETGKKSSRIWALVVLAPRRAADKKSSRHLGACCPCASTCHIAQQPQKGRFTSMGADKRDAAVLKYRDDQLKRDMKASGLF